MLNPVQNQIVYLMFLNGLLFLGLNFIARSILFPGGRGSRQLGYVLIVAVALVLIITQELDVLLDMKFPEEAARWILLGGFAVPVFLFSLVYYRIQRTRTEKSGHKPSSKEKSNGDH